MRPCVHWRWRKLRTWKHISLLFGKEQKELILAGRAFPSTSMPSRRASRWPGRRCGEARPQPPLRQCPTTVERCGRGAAASAEAAASTEAAMYRQAALEAVEAAAARVGAVLAGAEAAARVAAVRTAAVGAAHRAPVVPALPAAPVLPAVQAAARITKKGNRRFNDGKRPFRDSGTASFVCPLICRAYLTATSGRVVSEPSA
jgi:hypothetical protein